MLEEITSYLNKNSAIDMNKVCNNFKEYTKMYTHCEYKHKCYLQFYKVKTSVTKCRVSNSLQIPVDTSSVTDLFIQPYSLSTSSPNPTFTLFALESWQVLDSYKRLHTCSQMLPPNPGLNQEWKNAVSPP